LAGGGIYFPAGTRDADFTEVYERIRSKVEAREFETARKELYHPKYQWLAGIALFLLLAETLLTDRRAAGVQVGRARRAA
jgi:hypothetical protein